MHGADLAVSPFQLLNPHGDPICGEIRYTPGMGNCPIVIICHSFMAFKEWGFFPHVAEGLARDGFAVITFNFALNGVEGNNNRITEFKKFSSNTFTRELEDLRCVIDAAAGDEVGFRNLDGGRIGLLGHSRGGGIAIVHAANDTRVRSLATWSAISTFDRWSSHQKSVWRANGFLPLAKDSTVSPLRLGLGLLEDVEQHRDRLDITKAAGRLGIPWLIVHGREDLTVKNSEAELLYEESDQSLTKFIVLDHVSHLYNAASEAEDHYATLDSVLSKTSDWFHQHLTEE